MEVKLYPLILYVIILKLGCYGSAPNFHKLKLSSVLMQYFHLCKIPHHLMLFFSKIPQIYLAYTTELWIVNFLNINKFVLFLCAILVTQKEKERCNVCSYT